MVKVKNSLLSWSVTLSTTVPCPSGVRGLAVCSGSVVTLAEPEGCVVVEGSVLDGVVVLVAGGFTGAVAAGGVTVGFWSWLGWLVAGAL